MFSILLIKNFLFYGLECSLFWYMFNGHVKKNVFWLLLDEVFFCSILLIDSVVEFYSILADFFPHMALTGITGGKEQ